MLKYFFAFTLLLRLSNTSDRVGLKGTFDLSDANFKDIMMEYWEKPDTTALFVNLITGECTLGKCVRYIKEVNQVSKIVKKQTRVALIDCSQDP